MVNKKRNNKIDKKDISVPLKKKEETACEISLIKDSQEIPKMNEK